MAVATQIVSVFPGPADQNSYQEDQNTSAKIIPDIKYSKKTKKLQSLYQQVRTFRKKGKNTNELKNIWLQVASEFPRDWLLSLEILEYLELNKTEEDFQSIIKNHLCEMKKNHPEFSDLIDDGFKLIASLVKI